MSDTKTIKASKLFALVESDFDQDCLLALMEDEPQELLFQAAYKALYSPGSANPTKNQNQLTALPPT